jgi:hypothetical protein
MDRRIPDAKEVELLAGEFLHRSQRNLQLIFANRILARLSLNGDDLAFVARLDLLSQALIEALTLRVKSMDMILGRHTKSLLACRVA